MVTRRLGALLLVSCLLVGGACSSAPDGDTAADGTTDRGQLSPPVELVRLHVRSTNELDGTPKGVVSRASIALPADWRVVHRDRLTLREGTPACTYRVEAWTTVVSSDASDAVDAARKAVPTGDGTLLESGRRQSAAWRVVRHPGTDPIVVDGVRAQPLRSMSARLLHQTWLLTLFHATSDRGDECHSGTYRATLGPAIGDALATARASAYEAP